ncbi:MAG: hypothetical protein JXA20_11645 [Spirochaetes bacterium]|nr:hypothetical protein [Spirochaetota bacterium]
MNSRDRVIRAIKFLGPDRIPTCKFNPLKGDILPILILPPAGWQPPEGYFPYDIEPEIISFGLWKPKEKLPKNWRRTRYRAYDIWGNLWEVDGAVTYNGQVIAGALEKGWDQLDRYTMPDSRDPFRYKMFGVYRKLLGAGRYRMVIGRNFIFTLFHYIRGFEQAMMDLVEFPDKVDRLLDKFTDYFIGMVEMCGKRGVDGILFNDDHGTQQGLIIGRKLFQRFFMDRYKKVVDKTHEMGMHFILHSCGNIGGIVEDLVDMGIDALQLDSPNQTGIDFLADNFGGKIAFFNVVDIQTVFPKGSPKEIEEYARKMIKRLGSYNGGLVATTYPSLYAIGADTRRERIMFAAYEREYN